MKNRLNTSHQLHQREPRRVKEDLHPGLEQVNVHSPPRLDPPEALTEPPQGNPRWALWERTCWIFFLPSLVLMDELSLRRESKTSPLQSCSSVRTDQLTEPIM